MDNAHLQTDPIPQLLRWIDEAARSGIEEPSAMVLATADKQGLPSARVVLLRGADARGLVFFTNCRSRKGTELEATPFAALCMYWMPLKRQLRVQGAVEPVSNDEADAYFRSRPRESQLGAWASQQSQPLASRSALLDQFEHHRRAFEGHEVPRPPHWSGFRVLPSSIEFWEQGDHRLHHRDWYVTTADGWRHELLNP
jgi:pyridoxamine 5'-phosphate oxidase